MSRFRWSHLFARKTQPAGNRRRRVRPAVESLEERTLLAAAVQGVLDPTFGLGGLVTTNFNAVGQAVAIDPESGKILVAGSAFPNGHSDFALARYNSNGSLDTSFGSGGEVLTDFTALLGPGTATATSIAVQSDGKIVVGGSAGTTTGPAEFALARYNGNGTLDNNFGNQGLVVINFSSILGPGTVTRSTRWPCRPTARSWRRGRPSTPSTRWRTSRWLASMPTATWTPASAATAAAW